MPNVTHFLIPFAAPGSEAGRAALKGLTLPQLETLLARLTVTHTDIGDAHALTPSHERELARQWGLPLHDGLLPWAALQAREEGRPLLDQAWARVTPCHWQIGREHIEMLHPQTLDLSTEESHGLLHAMAPYFAQDGITLIYNAPTLWLAHGSLFEDLPTASLDRVVGREVGPWLPQGPHGQTLKRLQSEMQMLLYTHPINEAREAAGALTVNSFWLSSTGRLPEGALERPTGLTVMHYLRDAAMLGDWAGWVDAWKQFDDQVCPRLLTQLDKGHRVILTLCGEVACKTWDTRPESLLRQWTRRWRRQALYPLVESI